ncbi:MAG TPA: YtxH domain-containing protein [Gemmatimonadaceae bacterium]|nr:YtxH domain-containing protein [Gemmatimonadaceae bacterium]
MSHDYEEDEGRVVIVKRGGGIAPFLIGLAVGAGIALLYAPQSGAETRRLIRRKARRAVDTARMAGEDLADGVRDRVDRAKRRVEEGLDDARDAFDRERRHVRDTVRAGKDAARAARADLEARLAEAKAGRSGGEGARPRHAASPADEGDDDAGV